MIAQWSFLADTRRWINAGLTLVQRRRRWSNVKPVLIQRLVSAGVSHCAIMQSVNVLCMLKQTQTSICVGITCTWQVEISLFRHWLELVSPNWSLIAHVRPPLHCCKNLHGLLYSNFTAFIRLYNYHCHCHQSLIAQLQTLQGYNWDVHECLQSSWYIASGSSCGATGAVVNKLKLTAWKVRDRGFEPHSGLHVSKKQNVSSSLTRKVQYCGEPWSCAQKIGMRTIDCAMK